MSSAGIVPALPPPLPDAVLRRAQTPLPLKPPVPLGGLTGQRVALRTLHVESDALHLFRVSNGLRAPDLGISEDYDHEQLIWRYMSYGPFESEQELRAQLAKLAQTPDLTACCVCDRSRGSLPVGVLAFMRHEPSNLSIEVGHIWYSPLVQRSGLGTEAALLALSHCFEALGCRRVEWRCNALNERSARAAAKLGFQLEGRLRQHMVSKGRNRDTLVFSMLDGEWDDAKARLTELVGAGR